MCLSTLDDLPGKSLRPYYEDCIVTSTETTINLMKSCDALYMYVVHFGSGDVVIWMVGTLSCVPKLS